MRTGELRRDFLKAFWKELRVVWPILSVLIFAQLGLGMLIGLREGWAMSDATYFTFVTGLTIRVWRYLVPAHLGTRLMAIMIGFGGSLLTGLDRGGRCPSASRSHWRRGAVMTADQTTLRLELSGTDEGPDAVSVSSQSGGDT